jgi:hypothetical protein
VTDPLRDMDERLNVEGDPEAVMRAILAIPQCDPVPEPASGDEAIAPIGSYVSESTTRARIRTAVPSGTCLGAAGS